MPQVFLFPYTFFFLQISLLSIRMFQTQLECLKKVLVLPCPHYILRKACETQHFVIAGDSFMKSAIQAEPPHAALYRLRQ